METQRKDLNIQGNLDVQKNLQVNGNGFVFGKLEVAGSIVSEAIEVGTHTLIKNDKVGIGTQTPERTLHIYSNIKAGGPAPLKIQTSWGYMHIGARNNGWAHFYTDLPKYYFNKEIRVDSGKIGSYKNDLVLCTQGIERIRVKRSNGNIGIGINAPQTTLHVQGNRVRVSKPGTTNHYIDLRADGSALDLESSKALYLNNNGKPIFYRKMSKVSSRKFKEAIEVLSTNKAKDILARLNPVKYRYKNDPERANQLGFIAEELPEEIAAKDKGSVDPMDIITILCKVVQDQQQKLSKLSI